MTNYLIYAKISNMTTSYSKICSDILRVLPQKQKEVLSRRFALKAKAGGEKETLEAIGQDYGITRERVRQIERDGFLRLKLEIKKYQKAFAGFKSYLDKSGGLKREDLILNDLGGKTFKNEVYFLLNLGEGFERIGETPELYPLWTTDNKAFGRAIEVISSVRKGLEKTAKPLSLKELINFVSGQDSRNLASFVEISKVIQKNSEGLYGLSDWPEINPRGIKDRAFLVLRKEQKPLHFTQVAQLIDSALPQTVHNELIKDQRFVLVGRGLYALKEWGYEEGVVKDVIYKILKTSSSPLSKEEILEKTLKQRFVKENTVLLNLSNKKFFSRTQNGNYTVRES